MIATVRTGKGIRPCIVYWTGKTGLVTVETHTYCGEQVSAAGGVHQLPDNAPLCDDCKAAVAKAEAAITAVTS